MSLRHPPKLTYCGLTIVMSNPSRFDTMELLSANGGFYFTKECLGPIFNRYQCDIRLSSCKAPLLNGTRGVLLLGDRAMKEWLPQDVQRNCTLHELRGSPYVVKGIVHIASYLPQDAMDVQDYEKRLNAGLIADSSAAMMEDDFVKEDKSGIGEKKRHAKTSRSNYRFWLKMDTQKISKLIQQHNGTIPEKEETQYDIYPNSESIIALLSNTKNSNLFFDMETTYPELGITCFAFGFDLSRVYVVPVVRHDYSLAYTSLALARIFRALAIAIRDNTLVAHNGAGFDFLVLALKMRIPIGRKVYDTMIAQHRIYPEVEKSLGHCVSLWTYEPYHKDEAQFNFGSQEQARKLWLYCGKDVSTMIRIYEAQQTFAKTIPGLSESIIQANNSIRPYLITTLQGIQYNPAKIIDTLTENDRLLTQYLRIIRLLVGAEALKRIKPKSKTAVDCMPGSNAQCVNYFHRELGYDVIMRSKKTGQPSLAEKNMLKLRLKYNNPVIDLTLAFRQVAKESSSLRFTPVPWST